VLLQYIAQRLLSFQFAEAQLVVHWLLEFLVGLAFASACRQGYGRAAFDIAQAPVVKIPNIQQHDALYAPLTQAHIFAVVLRQGSVLPLTL
jgi:hypothetical protein